VKGREEERNVNWRRESTSNASGRASLPRLMEKNHKKKKHRATYRFRKEKRGVAYGRGMACMTGRAYQQSGGNRKGDVGGGTPQKDLYLSNPKKDNDASYDTDVG